jgi:hypothetical protein
MIHHTLKENKPRFKSFVQKTLTKKKLWTFE